MSILIESIFTIVKIIVTWLGKRSAKTKSSYHQWRILSEVRKKNRMDRASIIESADQLSVRDSSNQLQGIAEIPPVVAGDGTGTP